jgi:hypothetical protein
VAQTREQLLTAAERVAGREVAAHRAQVEVVRAATADLSEEQRLLARVTHWRELVGGGEQWQQRVWEAAARAQPLGSEAPAVAFAAALELAHEVLTDREPGAQDKLRSLGDPEVRTGKHGDYYEGYVLDVSMDAASEWLCALDVLPANAEEAANATQWIAREEHAHGNEVASLSIDRIGYRGDVLAALSDAADGPPLTVSVPPIDWTVPAPELFQPEVFPLTATRNEVRCPGGATTRIRQRTKGGHGGRFSCLPAQCQPGPLRAQCLQPSPKRGRSITKNAYEAQDHAVQQRTQTVEYRAVRREHPRIERT